MPAVNRYYSSVAVDTTLKFAITDPDGTSFEVNSTAGFPTSYPYTLAIGYDSSNEELVTIIGASGNILTVGLTVAGGPSAAGRGVDGTNNQTHTAGETVKHVISARDMTEAQAHIAAEAGAHGIIGSFVGTTDTQTLTNKTITGGTVNPTTLQQGGIPAVTTTGTQTLTNKTLTSPKVNEDVAVTATATELNVLDGITASTAELNIMDGVTASAAELNILDGATLSTTELNYVDGVTSAVQTQLNNNTPVGVVNMWVTGTAPTGWLLCQGQAVSRTTYSALWDVLRAGTSSSPYGNGDGSTTFNLPDFLGRVPMGAGTGTGLTARTLGTEVGSESTTLTSSHIPQHDHTYNISHDHGAFNTTGGEGDHYHTTAFAGELTSSLSGTSQTLYRLDNTQNYLYPATSTNGAHNHSIDVPNYSVGNATSGSYGTASPTAVTAVQPSTVINFIIKY